MNVYLVQHGQALSEERDPQRRLSDEGRTAAAMVAGHVAALGSRFMDPPLTQIWHSGKLRAEQTADVYARALAPALTPTPRGGMNPQDDPAAVYETLIALRDQPGALLIVGHLPHLARLTGLLLADDAEKAVVGFVNAGIVKVCPTESGWAVAGYITPACVP